SRRGGVRQYATPYAIDTLLRILHSLVLARAGGVLVHAASAMRGGRAFVFAGVSGAGKTTLARLAPPDVALLTDEISYIRPSGTGRDSAGGARETACYHAYGTPFAGELARIGLNVRAPLAGVFLLQQGSQDRIEQVSERQALRELLRHVLF